ncbi:hypothetical protein A8C56_18155 [Niabella ginsenosidivorans]|uniref:DUF5977 domain-containing protein n=1 Tax=Niabella ginsenosidivorans TaxID=1176587 RepID=A0A1A9I7G4_9BACT|nr:DUF5977 domain-containing protein [Niabella ginsenosidivorans]ANH82641.1 hypothetical protein A8C56_18155 [Niabella ginsenosidivorans]
MKIITRMPATIACCFFALLSIGQVSPLPILNTPKSPNTAAMERFGNYEVDLFRGLPQISIPLFEVKTKGLSVPISLDYHASGIKVTDVASWSGLGWNLSVAGAVTRTVRGRPDEETTGLFNITNPDPSTLNPSTPNGYYLLKNIFENTRDAEPDIFSFSVPNDNGKFVFINNQPVFIPYLPYKIAKATNQPWNFKLTNASGINYYFGGTATEGSSTQRGSSSFGSINSYLLTKMETPDQKDSVLFSYYPSQMLSYPVDWEDYTDITDGIQAGQQGQRTMYPNYISNTLTVSSMVDQRQLQQIIYPSGKIEFELDAATRSDIPGDKAKALKRLVIYGKSKSTYTVQKTINFYHSYFTGNNTSRLKLDSLVIASEDNAEKEVYRFTYDESSPFPAADSKSRDFWGYYNGKSNTTLIPGTSAPFSNGYITTGPYGQFKAIKIGGTDDARDPDSVKAQLGVLKRIQFPTGGYSVFNYELNRYSYATDTLLGGGLRIKSIFSFPSQGAVPVIKTYVYGQYPGDQSGVGIINSLSGFRYRNLTTKVEEFALNTAGGLPFPYVKQSWVDSYYSSNAYKDINDYDGTNVYYPFVTEYTGTSGANLSKSTYEYTFDYDQIVTNTYDRIPYATTNYWKRGKLTQKEDFKKLANNQYRLIHRIYNTYTNINNGVFPNAGILVEERVRRVGQFSEEVQDGALGYPLPYNSSYYDIYSGALMLSNTNEYTWDSTKNIIAQNLTVYNSKGLISSKKSITSAQDTLISMVKYPFEYNLPGSMDNTSKGLKNMNDLNIINQPVEEINGIKSPGGTIQVNSGSIKTFYSNVPVIKEDYYYERTPAGTNNYTASVVNTSGQFVIPGGFRKRLNYSLVDPQNNIIEYAKDGSKTALLWNEKGAIIAAAENAEFEAIAFGSFEDSTKGNWMYNESGVVTDNSLTTGNRVYSISPTGNISKNNVPVGSYIVSYYAKAACLVNGGAPAKTIPMGSLGWNYYEHQVTLNSTSSITVTTTATTLVDNIQLRPGKSTMKSLAYNSFANISAEIDEKGRPAFYNYNGLQRLINIKNEKGAVLKGFQYDIKNYPVLPQTLPVFYYSNSARGTFRKATCSSTENGSYVDYTVSYGSYVSLNSQLEADQMAQADLNQNGQNYADAYGSCILKTFVEWKPSGIYCQKRVDSIPTKNPQGYVVSVASAPGSNNYTIVTVSRTVPDQDSRALVKIVVNYLGGNPSINTEILFEVGESVKTRTVGGSEWLNSNRNGASIISIDPLPFYTYTNMYVYGTRTKYVGGEYVATEPNLKGSGTGPYFAPIRGDDNKCPFAFPYGQSTTEYPSTGAYASNKYFMDYYKQCSGGDGSRELYVVPSGKYTSLISQQDADQMAINDINTNGQTYANTVGTCPVSTAPLWTTTGNKRCVKDASNNNTGYQEQEEKDLNSNSPTYNQTRWMNIGMNSSACPVSQISITFSTKNNLPGAIYFMIFVDGVNYTGPRSIAGGMTMPVDCVVPINNNSKVEIKLSSGAIPSLTTLAGFWGTFNAGTSNNVITFNGINFSQSQTVNLNFSY